ncbi:MAG: Holliday junction resolvase RuvX [Bacillota bacterium]|uniref:Putative pre-16S rRNA nuclease n=1 Tax=Virgibacillus salarius TaxID=447199 RepID=A0A941DXH7_9BACI|nr:MULTISPECIES: Holliday junction resolvase RuvX [Bacillaceae]NAZ10042.1 Holliday junction resolvase RuvX [Agaribacter marinus]MBR7797332.1 Holliday junction resolvase RuvX [Virgibacillus salarius]MCC2250252.1 Holliday junction resolvase RuvX [Virgibacillus sp. AGTR]MDY7044617.1 Holliday junction resolvase RuvX [Virgibacillus sp. M23]QRZ17512.1 Holliday junction resolvase RuvX [Virgibacillus sp. AGTR]
MKVMGLDVGSKTIGVAVSDAFGWTAQGIKTIKWNEEEITSADEALKSIIVEHQVGKAIVGLPKNMNGTIGERGEASKLYAEHLEKVHGIETVLWDERLTTMAAERVLLEADMSRKKRKKVIDKMAAVMILQNYLDQK